MTRKSKKTRATFADSTDPVPVPASVAVGVAGLDIGTVVDIGTVDNMGVEVDGDDDVLGLYGRNAAVMS